MVKVKIVKSKRPDFNPMVEISFRATQCLAEGIQLAIIKKPSFVDEDDLIRSAIREYLNNFGIKPLKVMNDDADKSKNGVP